MDIRPIKTEADHQAALEEIDRLFDVEPNTPEADKLEVLITLVEAYEEEHYSIPLPDPIEAIIYHMESRGLSPQELEPYLGSRILVSEVLNRKRPLTLAMIQNLSAGLGISAEILVQPYACVEEEPQGEKLAVGQWHYTIFITSQGKVVPSSIPYDKEPEKPYVRHLLDWKGAGGGLLT